jgi:hypothetical protein
MREYILTITATEQSTVYRALKAGLFAANEQLRANVIGADAIVSQLEDALAIMNRAPEGGYESASERNAAFLADFAAECVTHGSD